MRERLKRIGFGVVAGDVRRFLERQQDAALLTRENLMAPLPLGPKE